MVSNKPEADSAGLSECDRKYLKTILSKDLLLQKRTCFALRLGAVLMFLFHLLALFALDHSGDKYFMEAYGLSGKTVMWWFAAAMSFLSCFVFYFSVIANYRHMKIFHFLAKDNNSMDPRRF